MYFWLDFEIYFIMNFCCIFRIFLNILHVFSWLFVVKHGYSLLSGCVALHNLQIANLVELFFCNYQLYHVIHSRDLSRIFIFTSRDHTAFLSVQSEMANAIFADAKVFKNTAYQRVHLSNKNLLSF